MKFFLYTVVALLLSTNAIAQNKVDLVFSVDAACGMCEARIEAAYDVKGIISADYDLKTHMLHVVYKTKLFPDTIDVHRIAANVGHDTNMIKATDEVYSNLHSCCKYREDTIQCSGDHDDHDHE
tara:strand:+ start:380 stop:751 length:372 start_codon:yes stop_codon:yes gene_type:complete